MTIALQYPVTIAGNINPNDGLLHRVEIAFDTISLLQSMIKQARVDASTAISRAATVGTAVVQASRVQHEEKEVVLAAVRNSSAMNPNLLSSVTSLKVITNIFSRHPCMVILTDVVGNKGKRMEDSYHVSNANDTETILKNNSETLLSSVEGFPSLLREIMAMFSKEGSGRGGGERKLSTYLNTNSRIDSYNCSTVHNCGDPAEGHSQPFTSFYFQPSRKAFNGISRNKRQRTKGFLIC